VDRLPAPAQHPRHLVQHRPWRLLPPAASTAAYSPARTAHAAAATSGLSPASATA
jgi:hypothetical protein